MGYGMPIPAPYLALAALLGLLVGSFLNVLIHRLPIMMERAWARECAALSDLPEPAQAPLNLLVPRSRCVRCGHPLRWVENIPVLSFVALRGRCSACGTSISWRYPVVEVLTAALFAYCAARWGIGPEAAVWSTFGCLLLACGWIDWDTTYLPDDLTLALLWLGLVSASLGYSGVRLDDALWGAVAGYLSLWLVFWFFKLLTGKDGMGYGDFKLFAALGAWFGWTALVPLMLLASCAGAAVGLGMKWRKSLREGGVVPFGPFLAGVGFVAMFIDPARLLDPIGL
jgi:leader peptidase (prepilin peptidase)/N-methyltransferase